MTTHPSYETVARLDFPAFSLQLAAHVGPGAAHEVYEEPRHVLALQRVPSLGVCEGRHRTAAAGDGYSSIGRLLFLPAAAPLEVRTRGRPDQVVRCVFAADTLRAYAGDCDVYDPAALPTFLDIRRREMTTLMGLIGDALASPGLARDTLAGSLGTALMVQFARYLATRDRQDAGHRGGLSRRHLRLITEAVRQDGGRPSLAELSELVGLSQRHLTRAFKQSTGVTVHTYVEQVRLARTKDLLADTDLLMKEIAAMLGFACAGGMSVAFRKLTGETPQAYRRRCRCARTTAEAARAVAPPSCAALAGVPAE